MSKNTEKSAVKNSIHFTLQGKGGVGKSLVSSILAQYFRNQQPDNVFCYDTDPINQTLVNYKSLGAIHVPLMEGSKINERKFDDLIETLIKKDGIFIVDNGASSFVPLSSYLIENDVIQVLKEAKREVFIHCVITGGQSLMDTLAGFAELAKQTKSNNIVIWLNEYFGSVEANGKIFTEMKVYQDHADKVCGILRIAKRNPDTFGKDIELMVSKNLTFIEAIESDAFPLMAKQRIKTVQRDMYDQLSTLEF
jgi:cellulose biosynthesis protein BcsQ